MKALLAFFCLVWATSVMSQVAISTDATLPDNSAILDVKSTTKGMLIPRMTLAERNAVASPAAGLIIFQTDNTPGLYYNSGTPSTPSWNLVGNNAGQWQTNGTTIYYNAGNVGIGTTSPAALLHTEGTATGQGNVLFVGQIKSTSPADPPVSGFGTRMMWYPDKAAFRAGYVESTQWDAVNIGPYSTATGHNTTASGWLSTAMGNSNIASGHASTAMGQSTAALGNYSTALGHSTQASGEYSITMGSGTTATAYNSTALGRFNVGGGTAGSWITTDPIFEIGIGSSDVTRSNAVTVLKNGDVGIGTVTPAALLHTQGTGTGEGNVVFVGEYKSSGPGNPPVSGAGTRMMWYPDKAAFRAGKVSGTQWDVSNIGSVSTAFGLNNFASGGISIAMGNFTTASGSMSTAMGNSTTASGNQSTATGNQTTASGYASFATGDQTTASEYASIAMGYSTHASGVYSTSMGSGTTASAYASTALGQYNIGGGTTNSWITTDPLFEIGNGSSDVTLSNAITVLKNGNVGIGANSPTALLHTQGTGTGQGNVVFIGEYKISNPGDPPVSGAGTRMMWYPDKAAFRAGGVPGTQWDAANIGIYSTAIGFANIAKGDLSTTLGGGNTASEYASTALGVGNTASGLYSFAMGHTAIASGYGSNAIGWNITSSAYKATALGQYNIGGGNPDSWIATDPLFEIGNGTSAPSNALTVLKNGNLGLGTPTPEYQLDVAGPANLNKGISGIALRCNGAETIWYNGTYFGWGYGGTYNYFADNVTIGTSSVPGYNLVVNGTAAKTDGGSWSVLSDVRLKNLSGNYDKGLNEIVALQPVKFFYKEGNPRKLASNDEQIGFIAQEVQKVFPEAVNECKDGFLDFNIHPINVALVNAVKELKAGNDWLKAENERLKAENETINERLTKIENRLIPIAEKL